MDPRFSLRKYPREDNVYRAHRSLNFDQVRTKIFKSQPKARFPEANTWLGLAILGFTMGFVASLMNLLEDFLQATKVDLTERIIGGELGNLGPAYVYFFFFSMGLAFLGSVMCVYWAPNSTGSGVAELICYLNGINVNGLFSVPVFVTKVIGSILAVTGNLCVGQEGPLAHIGGCIAAGVLYLPIPGFETMRNDVSKRYFVATGAAAGISVAFGSPIGGALIAFELSRPNNFWKFPVLWKCFVACALSVFSLALWTDIWNGGDYWEVTASSLKFGVVTQVTG